MVNIECERCEGTGKVRVGDRWSTATCRLIEMGECPDCWGDGVVWKATPLDKVRSRLLRTSAGRHYSRARRAINHGRQMWRERDAQTVAYVQEARRALLDDEPRLRSFVENEVKRGVGDEATPLGWRRDDLRWALTNARRALRGQRMLPLDYDEVADLSYSQEGSWFERGAVMFRAERRRRPVRRVS